MLTYADACRYKASQLGLSGSLSFLDEPHTHDPPPPEHLESASSPSSSSSSFCASSTPGGGSMRVAHGNVEGEEAKAERFLEWLCSVGAPGSFIEGAEVRDRKRSSTRLFSSFVVQN
jgi:hypothetical protein